MEGSDALKYRGCADRRYTGRMSRTAVTIPTPDGSCPASLFRPAGDGPWPAVLMYMDGVGMRPALFPIAERIADAGYLVLLPDLFYRAALPGMAAGRIVATSSGVSRAQVLAGGVAGVNLFPPPHEASTTTANSPPVRIIFGVFTFDIIAL